MAFHMNTYSNHLYIISSYSYGMVVFPYDELLSRFSKEASAFYAGRDEQIDFYFMDILQYFFLE